MQELQWIKLSVRLFDNRKIKRILSQPRGEEMLVFWLRLLCLSGQLNRDGALLFTEREPYDVASLAVECDLPRTLVAEWLEVFIAFGMMTKENGIYRITGWEKYQNVEGMERVREQTKARVKAYRERQREACNVTVTLRNAREEEEEKEEEQEKNSHSLSLACDPEQRFLLAREALGGKLGRGKVLLSEAQMTDLLERLSLEEFDHYVSVVADCEEQGKPFRRKTHYQAILEMAAKDRSILHDDH